MIRRVTDGEVLGKAESWEEVNAILTRRVERGDFIVRGMTEAEFDALPKDQRMEVLIENRSEHLSPEARRRLLP